MGSTVLLLYSISPGESPPPPPRACFGRERLIDEIVGLAENLTPIALIGAGGIGKTSIALAVLHHDRIKGRFGDNRRFIRCDQFPASPAHFLRRLSEVIGAEVESPEDLTPLRPLLSSREMILFLDNAESILDAHGAFTGEIYPIVEELAQFETVCLCITSRISTVPRHCRRPIIPTLSAESACAIFYHIYNGGVESDIVSNLLEQLDFHALSIVSLAATALVRTWDYDRLAREWDARHTGILTVGRATIELSLASPTFCDLRPDARDILSVIAFFPQGIGENNLDWLFPTIPDRRVVFDTFDILSLTYRNNGFITMPAPFRDYLYPKDPMSSPLLRTTKERYFSRLAVHVDPGKPDFEEAQWIRLEDTNVEHLLDAFTSMDTDSVDVWDACAQFMRHLSWHKRRLVALGPKIERLPDTHPSKPRCLFELSRLLDSVGDSVQGNQLLVRTLELWRERGDELQVAQTLRFLSNVNRVLGLRKEGISQANEALEIYERFDNVSGRAQCLQQLAWLLHGEKQLDAAELAASQAIDLLTGKDEEFLVYRCYRALGNICHSKGEVGKAIDHFKAALTIGEPFNWHDEQFHTHYSLARLFLGEIRFGDAHAHVKHAKSYAVNNPYLLGCAMELQARVWYKQCKFKDAESEALLAVDVFEELGATKELKYCRAILRKVGAKTDKTVTSGGSGSNGVGKL